MPYSSAASSRKQEYLGLEREVSVDLAVCRRIEEHPGSGRDVPARRHLDEDPRPRFHLAAGGQGRGCVLPPLPVGWRRQLRGQQGRGAGTESKQDGHKASHESSDLEHYATNSRVCTGPWWASEPTLAARVPSKVAGGLAHVPSGPGGAVRRTNARPLAVRHEPRGSGLCARHRRHHRGVQHLQRRAAEAAAVSGARTSSCAVYDTQPACATCPASYPEIHGLEDPEPVFAAIGGSTQASFVARPARAIPSAWPGVPTTASLVDVFGVQPQLGRWYTEQEDQSGRAAASSCSRTTSGPGSSTAIRRSSGARLTFDGEPYEVIGVMPRDVHAPPRASSSCRCSASSIPPRAATTSCRPTRG